MTTNQPDAPDLVSRIVTALLETDALTPSSDDRYPNEYVLDGENVEYLAKHLADVLAPYIAEREARLRSLVEALAIGGIPTFDENGIGIDHSLRVEEHGDGYQEPMEESWSCECEEWGINWVQTDPACTGRPVTLDVAFEWMDHVDRAAQHRSKP